MKTRVETLKFKDAYIVPISDLHIGDKSFNAKSRAILSKTINFVKEHENARVVLVGDLLNTATRCSKTSPFEQDMTLEEQITAVCEILEPIKDKIIGAVSGNHERRVEDFAGYDPTLSVLWKLGLKTEDYYFKYTGLIKLRLGSRSRDGKESPRTSYVIAFTHTTGGGKLIGSKLNRIDQMRRSTVNNADLYIGGHNHSLSTAQVVESQYNTFSENIEQQTQTLVSSGAYLDWNDSYAEAMQLEPMKMGSPIIKLSGLEKNITVTL